MDEEERVRTRAYFLWLEAGCPEGREDEFWAQAEGELAPELMDVADHSF